MEWIDELIDEITSLGIDYADKSAAANLLHESKANVLAKIKLDFEGIEKSDSARETRARATDEFGEFIEKMTNAKREAEIAGVLYDAAKRKCDLRRTAESTKRAEMTMR
jgi:hypothetical protein